MNKTLLKTIPEIGLVCVIFFLSIGFRLWFISLVPQPLWNDQDEYENYAAKILNDPHMLASHSYRSYPFPLAIAVFYKFVGFGNHQAVYSWHAILEGLTAVMIYVLLRESVKNRLAAALGMLIYAVNPITSGYVGVILSEVLAAFFITGTIFFGFLFVRKPVAATGILFGFFAGMAAETRNAAFIWAGVPIFLTFIWVRWHLHKLAYTGIVIGLILTVLYPLYTNWRDYGELSITKVDSFYAMEFFNGATLKTLPPFTKIYPPDQWVMWSEYYTEYHPGRTKAERQAIAAKYFKKGWDIVMADPTDYIRWRFFKMWYVWQKENIFFYVEPSFNQTRAYVYWGNIVLLFLAAIGFISGFFRAVNKTAKWLWLSIIGTVLYGTLAFSISHAEYRLTAPFYPLLILSAGWGIIFLLMQMSKIFSGKIRPGK